MNYKTMYLSSFVHFVTYSAGEIDKKTWVGQQHLHHNQIPLVASLNERRVAKLQYISMRKKHSVRFWHEYHSTSVLRLVL